MRSRALTGIVIAFLAMACGNSTPSGANSGSTGAPPPPAVVSEADFGHTVKVVPGQSIRVQLMDRRPFPGSSLVWTVSSTNPAVLELRSSEHGAAAPLKDSPYTAIFIARRSGTAQIQAVGATTCEAMRKSACPDRAADVTVEVA